MVSYYGDFAEDDTVNIPFNTFDSNDPANSVTATDLIASDIFVHKDGSATSIVTDGATIDIDAPGVGAHMITIDTSVHADYATGSEYAVRINGVTVDGGTVNAWIGAFSIERAGGVLALMKATTLASIKAETALIVADTNELQVDNVPGLIATLDAVVDTVKAETALIVADTNELQSDDVPTLISTLDAVVDTVKAETVLILADTNELQVDDIPSLIAALDAVVDTVKAETVLILADTAELQTDDVPTLIATLDAVVDTVKAETALIVADTNELQTDDVPTLIAALNDISVADILGGTITELAAIPAASPTLTQALALLYMAIRNKRDTIAAADEIHNDAGGVIGTAVLSDDTVTFVKGKYA